MNILDQVFSAIDQLNSGDPNIELVSGIEYGKEQLYSQRMNEQMLTFYPKASDELRIAAYAQHVQRWVSKRSDYPEGRAGYYQWRVGLGKMHAQLAKEEMAKAGYPEESQQQVFRLLTKQGIKLNADVQVLEDVICLVFLQYYFMPFAAKHSEEKVISIVQKTWAKMSEEGHKAALALELESVAQELIQKALG